MRSQVIFYSALLISLSFFWACNDEVNETPVENTVVNNQSALKEAFSHRIADTIALKAIEDYQEYISNVNNIVSKLENAFPDPGSKLVYGAKVDRSTLLEILNASNVGDSLYIMMGIKQSKSPMNSDSTELFFAIESDSLSLKSQLLGLESQSKNRWHYFDFTQPCPHACPDLYLNPIEQ